jgi:hypothetical protein
LEVGHKCDPEPHYNKGKVDFTLSRGSKDVDSNS